jgi:transcriptional regulator with XRE-family HTH domain
MIKEIDVPLSQDRETLYQSNLNPLMSNSETQTLSFGGQLNLMRKTAKLSQRALAFKTGIKHSTISRLENETRGVNISTVAVLLEALKPDKLQAFQLVASLAKEEDKAYINDLFGLSNNCRRRLTIYGLNTRVSRASTPVEKVREYNKRRGRSTRQIAEIGNIAHTSVSRFLKGEKEDLLGTSFISIVKGLGLTTQEEVMDLFYSFAQQRRGNTVIKEMEQKVS